MNYWILSISIYARRAADVRGTTGKTLRALTFCEDEARSDDGEVLDEAACSVLHQVDDSVKVLQLRRLIVRGEDTDRKLHVNCR